MVRVKCAIESLVHSENTTLYLYQRPREAADLRRFAPDALLSGLHFIDLHGQFRVVLAFARDSNVQPIELRYKKRSLGAIARRDVRDVLVMVRVAFFKDSRCIG